MRFTAFIRAAAPGERLDGVLRVLGVVVVFKFNRRPAAADVLAGEQQSFQHRFDGDGRAAERTGVRNVLRHGASLPLRDGIGSQVFAQTALQPLGKGLSKAVGNDSRGVLEKDCAHSRDARISVLHRKQLRTRRANVRRRGRVALRPARRGGVKHIVVLSGGFLRNLHVPANITDADLSLPNHALLPPSIAPGKIMHRSALRRRIRFQTGHRRVQRVHDRLLREDEGGGVANKIAEDREVLFVRSIGAPVAHHGAEAHRQRRGLKRCPPIVGWRLLDKLPHQLHRIPRAQLGVLVHVDVNHDFPSF
nr:MAG TPA: hypothetical protein [Caudoviricetes sp.]